MFRRPTIRQRAAAGRLDFESWISRLAEDQPDLAVAENLRNRSLFAAISEATYEAGPLHGQVTSIVASWPAGRRSRGLVDS